MWPEQSCKSQSGYTTKMFVVSCRACSICFTYCIFQDGTVVVLTLQCVAACSKKHIWNKKMLLSPNYVCVFLCLGFSGIFSIHGVTKPLNLKFDASNYDCLKLVEQVCYELLYCFSSSQISRCSSSVSHNTPGTRRAVLTTYGDDAPASCRPSTASSPIH